MRDTHRERGRDTDRGRSRLPAGNLMWDSIPGPCDHDLSRRQTLNHGATQVPQCLYFLYSVMMWLSCAKAWVQAKL